ncbi:MAG: biopolymer transporter ExbD [Bacteroidales bacterium]
MSGMTDIVFLLLIFFMLTSTLIAPNALKMLLPSRGQTVTVPSESAIPTVTIRSGSQITVDGRSVSLEELGAVLDQRLQGTPDPTIKLETSSAVSVGDAVKVMNVAAERQYTIVLKEF